MTLDGSDVTAKDEGGDNDGGCPHSYQCTKRSGDFTSRNGGWKREGITLYNELFKKARGDRHEDNGAFGQSCTWSTGQVWRNASGADQNHQLATICDDLEQLWTAADIEEI